MFVLSARAVGAERAPAFSPVAGSGDLLPFLLWVYSPGASRFPGIDTSPGATQDLEWTWRRSSPKTSDCTG